MQAQGALPLGSALREEWLPSFSQIVLSPTVLSRDLDPRLAVGGLLPFPQLSVFNRGLETEVVFGVKPLGRNQEVYSSGKLVHSLIPQASEVETCGQKPPGLWNSSHASGPQMGTMQDVASTSNFSCP